MLQKIGTIACGQIAANSWEGQVIGLLLLHQ